MISVADLSTPHTDLTLPLLLFVSLSLTRTGKCVSKQIGKGVFVAGAAAAVVGSAALVGVAVSNAADNEINKEDFSFLMKIKEEKYRSLILKCLTVEVDP